MNDLFDLYRREINEFKKLSPAEEKKLALLIEAGDVSAFQKMAEAHLRLIAFKVGKLAKAKLAAFSQLDILDFIQDANLALLERIAKFNHRCKCRLATFIFYPILGSIKKSAADQLQTVHISRDKRKAKLLAEFKRVAQDLEKKLCRTPDIYEVASELGISLKRAEQIDRMLRYCLFVNINKLVAKTAIIPDLISGKVLRDDLKKILSEVLTTREAKILELRFGLDDGVEHELKEIGDIFGVSKSAIYLNIKKALGKLRDNKKIILFN